MTCEVCERKIEKDEPAYKISSVKKGAMFPHVNLLLCEDCYIVLRKWVYENFKWKEDPTLKTPKYKRLVRRGLI